MLPYLVNTILELSVMIRLDHLLFFVKPSMQINKALIIFLLSISIELPVLYPVADMGDECQEDDEEEQ